METHREAADWFRGHMGVVPGAGTEASCLSPHLALCIPCIWLVLSRTLLS